MKSNMVGNKIILEFDIGEYNKDFIDYLTMLEISRKSKATQEDIDNLADEINKDWWQSNKNRFLNENCH
jgi:predicted ThiF/HesA family dinucleotide-utilizing enzyme